MGVDESRAEGIHPERSEQIAAGLERIGLVLREESWRRSRRRGLSAGQSHVLRYLAGRAEASLSEVARELAVSATTASETISFLVKRGLVTRSRSSRDRRQVALRLTQDGRAKAREVGEPLELLSRAIRAMSAFDQAQFVRLLVRLIQELQDAGVISVARVCVSCSFFRPFLHQGSDRPHHCAFVNGPLGEGDLKLDCADFVLETNAVLQAERRVAGARSAPRGERS